MPSLDSPTTDQREQPAELSASREPAPQRPPRGSRRRAAVLLGVCAFVVLAVLIVVLVTGGSSDNDHAPGAPTPASGQGGNNPAAAAPAPSASSNALPAPSAKINLVSPTGHKSTFGLAVVLRRGGTAAIAIVGKGLPPNTKHNAYAIWLYNSPTDAVRLGFVNPDVGKNGHLDTAGGLPANAARFKKLLVTLETTANPTSPGPTVLEGAASGI